VQCTPYAQLNILGTVSEMKFPLYVRARSCACKTRNSGASRAGSGTEIRGGEHDAAVCAGPQGRGTRAGESVSRRRAAGSRRSSRSRLSRRRVKLCAQRAWSVSRTLY
jgi:hypothetical protein